MLALYLGISQHCDIGDHNFYMEKSTLKFLHRCIVPGIDREKKIKYTLYFNLMHLPRVEVSISRAKKLRLAPAIAATAAPRLTYRPERNLRPTHYTHTYTRTRTHMSQHHTHTHTQTHHHHHHHYHYYVITRRTFMLLNEYPWP